MLLFKLQGPQKSRSYQLIRCKIPIRTLFREVFDLPYLGDGRSSYAHHTKSRKGHILSGSRCFSESHGSRGKWSNSHHDVRVIKRISFGWTMTWLWLSQAQLMIIFLAARESQIKAINWAWECNLSFRRIDENKWCVVKSMICVVVVWPLAILQST